MCRGATTRCAPAGEVDPYAYLAARGTPLRGRAPPAQVAVTVKTLAVVMLVPAAGGVCWWRHHRGADCAAANTIVTYGKGRQFLACQHHREEIAGLIARHTGTSVASPADMKEHT